MITCILGVLAILLQPAALYAAETAQEFFTRVNHSNSFSKPVQITIKEVSSGKAQLEGTYTTLGDSKRMRTRLKTGPMKSLTVADGTWVWSEMSAPTLQPTVMKTTLAVSEAERPGSLVKNPFLMMIEPLKEVMDFEPPQEAMLDGVAVYEINGKLRGEKVPQQDEILRVHETNPERAKLLLAIAQMPDLKTCKITFGRDDLVPRRIDQVSVTGKLLLQYILTFDPKPALENIAFTYTPDKDAIVMEMGLGDKAAFDGAVRDMTKDVRAKGEKMKKQREELEKKESAK